MERKDDAELIEAILSGDDAAFGILVERHEKSVHAFVWDKIGDFHYAEEITQDAFLSAYENLSTLREPSRFLSWVYAIANNLCLKWIDKQKSEAHLQSLEDTPMEEIAEATYTDYVSEQRETETTEHRTEIVKKFLEKLSESERTVMVLRYLGEMTTQEISEVLGVSTEAIRVRLHRAKKRLRKEEALLIREVLGGVQIPPSLKQNIMQRVADMKPTPSPRMAPFVPWVAIGTVLVVATALLFSVSTPYRAHFQKLYSIYVASEAEDTKGTEGFTADLSITLGTHRSGRALLEALREEKCRISLWSTQALENPAFPVAASEITVDIVVVSMRELGFAASEFVTLATIYARAQQMGLETCPLETAVQLRLQFLDQPDWTTQTRLAGFFVASEPFVLTREGLPKIFSVVSDDRYPHPDTGIGLWLIANGTFNAGDAEHPDRLFNASDPDGRDLRGRFAFVLPK